MLFLQSLSSLKGQINIICQHLKRLSVASISKRPYALLGPQEGSSVYFKIAPPINVLRKLDISIGYKHFLRHSL
jgi:hypothetical protein